MPSTLLIFDAEYVSELTSRMNTACELMADAVNSLKSASNHDNWKCKERTQILDSFDNLNVKLGRLDAGVNETTRILGGSVVRFASLESQYESQANGLSDELTNNHGYSGTVHTDNGGGEDLGGGGVPSGGSSAHSGSDTIPDDPARPSAGNAAAAPGHDEHGLGHVDGHGHGGHGAGGAAGAVAGRVAGEIGRRPHSPEGPHGEGQGAGFGPGAGFGGGTMNVNLPVTHIPDSPDAAARGIKDTREIAHIAVTSVVSTMTEVLVGGNRASFSAGASFSFEATAPSLAEAYNAGRTIFESSNAIMSSPTMPHVDERIAMASGLAELANLTSQGALPTGVPITIEGGAGMGGNVEMHTPRVHASADISSNAHYLLEVVPEEAGEFRQVLGMITGAGSASGSVSAAGVSSGSSGESFFDQIVNALKNAASGNSSPVSSAGTSSLFSSSPVMDFLSNIMG